MQRKWSLKKNSCTAVRKKKKMLQSYFIIQIALQNPSESATILPLLSFKLWIWWCCACRIIASYKQCITIDISRNQCRFRVACGLGKSGFLSFLSSFFSVRKWWPEKAVPRNWFVFTAKSTRNTTTLFYVQLWGTQFRRGLRKGWAKIIRAIFHVSTNMIPYKFQFRFHTCFGDFSPLLNCNWRF